MIDKIKVLRLR